MSDPATVYLDELPPDDDYTDCPFPGFESPNYVQVPVELFKRIPDLSEADLKTLLYIIFRTRGWGKAEDQISVKQLSEGITKSDGTVLDRGTGLKPSTLKSTLRGLRKAGYITAKTEVDPRYGSRPTTYGLRLRGAAGTDRGGTSASTPGVLQQVPTIDNKTIDKGVPPSDPPSSSSVVVPPPSSSSTSKSADVSFASLSDGAREALNVWRQLQGKPRPPKLTPALAEKIEAAVIDLGQERLASAARWAAENVVPEPAKWINGAYKKRQLEEQGAPSHATHRNGASQQPGRNGGASQNGPSQGKTSAVDWTARYGGQPDYAALRAERNAALAAAAPGSEG